jgi:hypothetical protein
MPAKSGRSDLHGPGSGRENRSCVKTNRNHNLRPSQSLHALGIARMWCPTCKAEVAAEVAADNRRVRCATCGGEIPMPASFPGMAKTREARELLDRWASERQSDREPARAPSTAGRAATR